MELHRRLCLDDGSGSRACLKRKGELSKRILDGVVNQIELPRNAYGIDVGCGSGALSIALAKKYPNAKVVGIDRFGHEYASFSLDLCRNNAKAENTPNVSFYQGDARELPFADGSFDFVVSNYVYHNIPGDKQKYVLESLRVLKKGVVFAIHDWMSKSKCGDLNELVKKRKDLGYEEGKIIPSTEFCLSKREELVYGLKGSALLIGRK